MMGHRGSSSANTRKTPRFLRFTEPCDKRGVVQLVTTPASQSALWQVPARRLTPAGRGAWTRFQSPNKCSIMRAGAERAEVTVEQVVRELKLIGFSDIRKVVSWRNELVTRTEKGKDGEPEMVLMPRVTIVDADKISDEAAAAVAEVSQSAVREAFQNLGGSPGGLTHSSMGCGRPQRAILWRTNKSGNGVNVLPISVGKAGDLVGHVCLLDRPT